MSRRPRVHESDVDALNEQLQTLLAARGVASEEEIVRYEADRERLLDLIGEQFREQRDYDESRRRVRAQIERDDSDGWFADGYDAAHQAHLDALAHVDDLDPQADQEPEPRRPGSVVSAASRGSDDATTDLASVERRIGDIHRAVLVEDTAAARPELPTIGQPVLDDDAGQTR